MSWKGEEKIGNKKEIKKRENDRIKGGNEKRIIGKMVEYGIVIKKGVK